MYYLTLKALHIIGIISWFSALFFVVRMFIYHVEALGKDDPEKTILVKLLTLSQKRVWFIVLLPAMLLAIVAGVLLMFETAIYKESWFHFKLLFIFGLIHYTGKCGKMRRQLLKEIVPMTSFKLRLFNEVPALFLVAIVFTVYFRDVFSGIWAISIFVALVVLGFLCVKFWKKKSSE